MARAVFRLFLDEMAYALSPSSCSSEAEPYELSQSDAPSGSPYLLSQSDCSSDGVAATQSLAVVPQEVLIISLDIV